MSHASDQAEPINKAPRWVVKIGSALLTDNGKGLDNQRIKDWVAQLAALHQQGCQIALVSSGSVAEGISRMGWTERPKNSADIQAAAAIGQSGLIQAYEQAFKHYNIHIGQVLLTHDDIKSRKRYLNARNTINALLKHGVIPIINENDTVAIEELRLGDNDTLGAQTANLIEANDYLILTDQQGLFDADPRTNPNAQLIRHAEADSSELLSYAGDSKGELGRGGMRTKVLAAQSAARSGCSTHIVDGLTERAIERVVAGESLGTTLVASEKQLSQKALWIAGQNVAMGRLTIDEGAKIALLELGKSLLPIGVQDVQGDFNRGDGVDIFDASGQLIGKGLSNFSAVDANAIKQMHSKDVVQLLGYQCDTAMVHRDNLIVL